MSIPLLKVDERRRILRLLAGQKASVRAAFTEFLRNVTDPKVLTRVGGLLQRNDIEGALRIVDEYVVRLGNMLTRQLADVAQTETQALIRKLPQQVGVAISFNPVDPRMVRLMQNNRLRWITEFGRQQRQATREALVRGIRAGQGTVAIARTFRNSIGLTYAQTLAVDNYRLLLEQNNRQALQRELRDRRFDRTVDRVFSEGDLLEESQIERMVTRYQERYLQLRAETISRTESQRIMQAGQHEAFDQVLSQAQIPDDMVEREWIATQDPRTRDSHAEMDGQIVQGMDEPFVSPSGAKMRFPGDDTLGAPAEELINCRCSVLRRIKTGDTVEETEEEIAVV